MSHPPRRPPRPESPPPWSPPEGGDRKAQLELELDRIMPLLKADPQVKRVLLFGSLARDRVRRASDLDLIVVRQTPKRFLARLEELYDLLLPRVGLDLLVYTPEEFEQMCRSSIFVRRALDEGRVLYAA